MPWLWEMIISLQNSLTKTKRVLFVQHSHQIYWHAKRMYEIINAQTEEKTEQFQLDNETKIFI